MKQRSDYIAGYSSSGERANLSHLGIVQLRHAMSFAARFNFRFRLPVSTAFANHVLHIVLCCTREQMFRIYAERIVAGMENLKTPRNWADTDYESPMVSKIVSAVAIDGASLGIAARLNHWASPLKALAVPLSTAPELLYELQVG